MGHFAVAIVFDGKCPRSRSFQKSLLQLVKLCSIKEHMIGLAIQKAENTAISLDCNEYQQGCRKDWKIGRMYFQAMNTYAILLLVVLVTSNKILIASLLDLAVCS